MKFFALWCLLFSFSVMAQKEISAQQFQSQVKPQLWAIVSEFYQMIEQFPEYPKGFNRLISLSRQFEVEKQNLIKQCPRFINPECLPTIESMLKLTQELDYQTTTFYGALKTSEEPYISGLTGLRFIDHYQSELITLKNSLEFASFTFRAKKSKIKTTPIILNFDRMRTYLSLCVPEFSPYIYKKNFTQFYMNFIGPVERYLGTPLAHTFFYQNLKEFNFSLNLIHQNLTKRSKKTPTGMGSGLNNLQFRWNQIMRVYY